MVSWQITSPYHQSGLKSRGACHKILIFYSWTRSNKSGQTLDITKKNTNFKIFINFTRGKRSEKKIVTELIVIGISDSNPFPQFVFWLAPKYSSCNLKLFSYFFLKCGNTLVCTFHLPLLCTFQVFFWVVIITRFLFNQVYL